MTAYAGDKDQNNSLDHHGHQKDNQYYNNNNDTAAHKDNNVATDDNMISILLIKTMISYQNTLGRTCSHKYWSRPVVVYPTIDTRTTKPKRRTRTQ